MTSQVLSGCAVRAVIQQERAAQSAQGPLQQALDLADDAIAFANEWDKRMWEGPGHRVMDPDLSDLYRRSAILKTALAAPPWPLTDEQWADLTLRST